ncbi:MAG TPA: amidohydrolase family protein [Burkholderiales bacterium]|nr:amidohydrolase family protein [Burkholderiales bacterium]
MTARREFLAACAALGGAALAGCAGTETQKAGRRYARVIDAHAHWYPQEFVTLMQKEGPANGAKMGTDKAGNPVVLSVPGGTQTSSMRRNMTDLDLLIKEMDEREVDMYALSMTNPMVYWASPVFALKLSQATNDAGSAAHLKHPQRFVSTIMLPMHAPDLAVQELERAAKLPGLRGINMAMHVNGKNIHEKQFWPVYERAEAYGLPLFLHNLYQTGAERMNEYFMINVLGNPYESGYAAASLIYGGVLDAFPKLEVYLPHSGGTFPWLIGRFDYGIGVSPALKHMKQPASAYLRRFWYDTLTHHPGLMKNVIDLVGVDRIAMGTDFPQGMALNKPVDFVEQIPGLTRREREMILSENPARLLKLS